MIDITSINNISISGENEFLNKSLLRIVEDILISIDKDKIDQFKSTIYNNEILDIRVYSKNNICCPVLISCEKNTVNILIGVGEVIYLDNMLIFDEQDILNLKSAIEDLFYLPIEETIVFKGSKVLSSSCIINQKNNGKFTIAEYKHTHHFSLLSFGKKKEIYNYISWRYDSNAGLLSKESN